MTRKPLEVYLVAAFLGFVLLCACVGTVGPSVGADPGGGGSPAPADSTAGGPRTVGAPPALAPYSPGPSRLRRLTASQYLAELQALLGAIDASAWPPLDEDVRTAGFVSVTTSLSSVTTSNLERYESYARQAADQVFANPTSRSALVGCAPGGVQDDACLQAFVGRFGRRAFRRPLDGVELDRYVRLGRDAAVSLHDFFAGARQVALTMLQSPKFLYRTEIGRGPEFPNRPGVRTFDDYELASRLAFLISDRGPDDPLLDAAAKGRLLRPEGRAAELARLLGSQPAAVGLSRLFEDYLRISDLKSLPSDPIVDVSWIPAMRKETLSATARIVDADADLATLLTSRETLVDAQLARLYGVKAASPMGGLVTLPSDGPRRGLLGQAAVLALRTAAGTPAIVRGKYIREALLCESIPPPDIAVQPLPPSDTSRPLTTRQRLAQHRTTPQCAACHGLLDPPGLALETFDGVGRGRSTEDGLAIDPSGDLDGRPFADARELGALIAADRRFGDCFVRGLFLHAFGREPTPDEAPFVASLAVRFRAAGRRIHSLVVDLVASDAFGLAGPPA